MTGVAALAICAAFTSCSKSEELFNQGAIDQQKGEKVAQSYNEAFVQVFGNPAADQDWGFNSDAARRSNTRAATRGTGVGEVIKPDSGKDGIFEFTNEEKNNTAVWRSPEGVSKYVAPITDGEREFVQAWFDNPDNAGLSEEGREFNSFYVQQVYNKLYSDAKDNKDGYFWEMKNGVEEKTNKKYKVKMDQLRIGSARDEANTVHINDFNATDKGGNVWNAIYVKDGSSKQFGYYASYGSQWQWKFRCVELTVPGENFPDGQARKGYYVGLSYYCDKVEIAGQKGEIIGEDEIDICNDWILKIVPGETIPDDPNYTIRVIGEDLTFGEDDELSLDFDFNDVVFDVALNVPGKTYIKVKAAGGTLPLIIGVANPDNAQSYNDNEVHHILGYSDTSIMINTNAASKGLRGGSAEDGILILNTAYNNAREIPVFVKKNGVWCELAATAGEPASKIGISNMNFRWCDERTSMKGTYPLFADWVQATAEFRGTIVWW